ncbi:PQQ-binding-like beta-propeller repeat protein [Bacillus mycoides]|uniref:outer membrane protein assembly factor BamB family protein n=1 Tax=Bacillus mycoides TaxID=1405 RepID=UPI003D0502C1
MGTIKEGFNIKLKHFQRNELEILRGEVQFCIDNIIIYAAETNIIEPLTQFFDAWIGLIKYKESNLFLDQHEKELSFIQQNNTIKIIDKKKIASIERVHFLQVLFQFCKTHIKNLVRKVPTDFYLYATYKRMMDIEPFSTDLILNEDKNIFRGFSSENNYRLKWNFLQSKVDERGNFSGFSPEGDYIYVGMGPTYEFSKINTQSKEVLWSVDVSLEENGIVYYQQDGEILLGCVNREEYHSKLFCVSAEDGELLWEWGRTGETKEVHSLPNCKQSILVVMENGVNIVLDIQTGKEKYVFNTDVGGENLKVYLFQDYYVLIGNPYENEEIQDEYTITMTAIELNTYSILWRRSVDCGPNAPTYVKGNTAFVVGYENIEKWHLHKECPDRVMEIEIDSDDRHLYLIADDMKIVLIKYIYDAESAELNTCIQFYGSEDGTEIYNCILSGNMPEPPILFENGCCVVLENGKACWIDTEKKQVNWFVQLENNIMDSPLFLDGKMYISSQELEVKCVDVESGKEEYTLYLPKLLLDFDFIKQIRKIDESVYFICNSGNVIEVVEN